MEDFKERSQGKFAFQRSSAVSHQGGPIYQHSAELKALPSIHHGERAFAFHYTPVLSSYINKDLKFEFLNYVFN